MKTIDNSSIKLTHYVGTKQPPIILIHGMGGNHKMFDWDENHSLARFLAENGWDVWMLDLRTHDGDGDFFLVKGSDREYINRYWDFDRTLLKIDVVTAVDYVKNKTGVNKIFLSGHSYGGYLAYAYAELIGEENLSGIITTGSCPYADPRIAKNSLHIIDKYGIYLGKKAFVRPFGRPFSFSLKWEVDWYIKQWKPTANDLFYYNTTPEYIQKSIVYCSDSEPAGVYVDMFFGKDPTKYNGHWVDPQTLYDYSANLNKITVPILFIAGDNDTQDPSIWIHSAYENVSSEIKEFHSFPKHSHLDLLLGDDASTLIFPLIVDWLNLRISP
ncbi:MAG: alpha/beta hydrolase [Candidatus Thermoplasmatota archaeon]|nr:alpha/beta hydrolase [Candidatus Thermoplasmatota archaeon]